MDDSSAIPETPHPPTERGLSCAEIARDWGTSRAYVSKCVGKGCPTSSLEAAREWRQNNATYGVGYRSKSRPKQTSEKRSETSTLDENESPPPENRVGESPPPGSSPPIADSIRVSRSSVDLRSLESSLQAAIVVEQEAYSLVRKAQEEEGKTSVLEARIRAYNSARDGRFAAERAFREEMERQRVLVPLAEAKALCRRGYDVIVPLLRSLPKNASALCNPSEPLHAARILEREVEAIIAQAQAEYAA